MDVMSIFTLIKKKKEASFIPLYIDFWGLSSTHEVGKDHNKAELKSSKSIKSNTYFEMLKSLIWMIIPHFGEKEDP